MSTQSDLAAVDAALATASKQLRAATLLLAAGNTKVAKLDMVTVTRAIAAAQKAATALAIDLKPPAKSHASLPGRMPALI